MVDLSQARHVLEMKASGCKYAVAEDPTVPGGLLFCQAPAVRGSYCAGHAALTYSDKPLKPIKLPSEGKPMRSGHSEESRWRA